MKLLLDANISWRLVKPLQKHFESCIHVDSIGLAIPPKDFEIWSYALSNDLIIVTNDEDFLNFANIHGFPPKVVLLRTGNQSNRYVESLLMRHITDIDALHKATDYGVMELF